MSERRNVTVMVTSANVAHITRAAEALARVAAGLALEGVEVNMRFGDGDFGDGDDSQ